MPCPHYWTALLCEQCSVRRDKGTFGRLVGLMPCPLSMELEVYDLLTIASYMYIYFAQVLGCA